MVQTNLVVAGRSLLRRNPFLCLAPVFALTCVFALSTSAAPVVPEPESGEFAPLDAPPGSSIPEMDEAISAYRRREYDKCVKILQEAKEKHPELPPAHLVLAKLFLKDNLLPQGRAILEKACIDAPDNPEIYLIFGQLSLLEKRLSDANLNYTKAQGLIESGKFSDEQKTNYLRDCLIGLAGVQESRALQYTSAEDWKAAEQTLHRLVEILPNASAPRQRLAQALFFQDRPDEAFGHLEAASKIDPQMAPPAVGMAWLFNRKGNTEQAEQWMRKAVEQYPDDPNSHANYAQFLLNLGRVKEADQFAQNALKKDSQNVKFLRLKGEIARQLKDYEEAERIFAELTAKYPAELAYSNLLALSLIEQIDLAKHRRALEYAESNYQRNKNRLDVLTTLGRVYYRLGDMDRAEAVLRNALRAPQISSETAYYMGLVAADRGRVEEAKQMYKLALDTPGPFLFREDAADRLKRLEGPATGSTTQPTP